MAATQCIEDLHPVRLEWHEETEQTEPDSIHKNCGNVSKMLQETTCKATVLLKVLATCLKML